MAGSIRTLLCLLLFAPYVAGQDSVNPSITTLADTNSDGEKTPGYAIMTTPQIQQVTTLLDPNDPNSFIRHKESLGFRVQVITDAHAGKTGDNAAENIRAWLQRNYAKYHIQYVLLIGDPRPEVSEIPMRTLFPEAGESVLSDLYYADLTGNWDLDGDGLFGEWGEDFGSGGVDRHWEVMVGRIPCYKAEGAQLPYADSLEYLHNILEKTIRYERQTNHEPEWRKNALLAMC